MTELIQARLKQIEKDRKIKILFAVESGSRAWGFHSQDSDYDVRFVYVPDITYYFKVHNPRDVIEIMEGDLDFSGWELRKALGLLYKGNPPLLEWLNSPLIYQEHPQATPELRTLSRGYYDAKKAIYHYLHMAEGNYRSYIEGRDEVRVKKYLYVLRPLLACNWIREVGTMPPMEIDKTLELIKKPLWKAHAEINELLLRKKSGDELGLGPKNDLLNIYIQHNLGLYNDYVRSLKSEVLQTEPLSEYLYKWTHEIQKG